MARTQAQIDRKLERKMANTGGYTAASSFTMRQTVFHMIVDAVLDYLDADGMKRDLNRGIVRGMTTAYVKMYVDPYEQNFNSHIKLIEKQTARYARQWNDEDPDDGHEWWISKEGEY